jgi:hypothetical protein
MYTSWTAGMLHSCVMGKQFLCEVLHRAIEARGEARRGCSYLVRPVVGGAATTIL